MCNFAMQNTAIIKTAYKALHIILKALPGSSMKAMLYPIVL